MRAGYVLLCVFLLSLMTLAQQAPNQNNPGNAPAGDQTKTVEGCVSGVNGSWVLSTPGGDRYRLKGHHSALFHFNGKEVRITGTVSPDQPQTLQISKIDKTNDSCQ
jgi:hypothetical protein